MDVAVAADMCVYHCFHMSTCIMWGGNDVAMCPTAEVHAEVYWPAGLADDMMKFSSSLDQAGLGTIGQPLRRGARYHAWAKV